MGRGYTGGLAATAYEVNDQVMVFSNHRNAWVEGKVTAVHRDGSCDVKYKENGTVQQVPIQDQPIKMKKDLTAVAATAVPLPTRRRVSATPAIPVPIAEEPVVSAGTVKRLSGGWTKFKVGHRVKVYSQSQQKWVMAEVTKISQMELVSVRTFKPTTLPQVQLRTSLLFNRTLSCSPLRNQHSDACQLAT